MNKDAVLRIRLPSRAKALIREAADREGVSMSDFTLEAALERAGFPLLRVVPGDDVPKPVKGQLTLADGLALSERK